MPQGLRDNPEFANLINDPEFNGLDHNAQMAVLEHKFGETKQEIKKVNETGEIKPGISRNRERVADTFSDYVAPGIETVGGVGGGILGGSSGGPAGMAGGGALGYGLAKSITRPVEQLLRGEPTENSVMDALKTSAGDVSEGLAYEMIPAAGMKTLEKIIAPLKNKLTTKAIRNKQGKMTRIPTDEKLQLLKDSKASGIDLLPTDVTKSKTMGIFEKILEGLPISSDVMTEFRFKGQLEPLLENLDSLKRSGASTESIEDLGVEIWTETEKYLRNNTTMSDDQMNMLRDYVTDAIGTKKPTAIIAEEGQSILAKNAEQLKAKKNDAYSELAEKLPKDPMSTPNLTKTADDLLSKIETLPGQGKIKTQAKWGQNKGAGTDISSEKMAELDAFNDPTFKDKVLADMGGTRDRTPQQVDEYIKSLNESIKKEDALQGLSSETKQMSRTGKYLGDLKKSASKDFDEYTDQFDHVKDLKKKAKGLHIKYKETYGDKDIQALLKGKPKDIIKKVVLTGDIQGVRKVKEAMGEEGFEKIKQGLTNELMGSGKDDIWKPEYLRQQLRKYGDDVLTEVYGKETTKALKQIAVGGLDLTKQQPGGPFLRSILKKDPEVVVDALIGSRTKLKDTTPLYSNAKQIKKAIPKEKFNELGDELFRKISNISPDSKLPQPTKFAKAIDQYGDRLEIFYPKEKVAELKKLASLSRDLYTADKLAGNPSETGRTIMNWSLVQWAMNLPGASMGKWMVAGTFGPAVKGMAKFYTSPAGRKFLTEGYTIPKNAKEATELAGRITAYNPKEAASFVGGTINYIKGSNKEAENKKEQRIKEK